MLLSCDGRNEERKHYIDELSKYLIISLNKSSSWDGRKDYEGKVKFEESLDMAPFFEVTYLYIT